MRARQQGGGHHDRNLFARHRGNERGAHRHLGLAEADIAAHQPVHRPPRRQIADHVADGFFLVFGLLIGKPGGEFVIQPGGRLDRRQ